MNENEKYVESNINSYEVYTTKLYRTIPKNSVLIVRNKFNGKDVEVKEGGFAIIAPWKESKFVSLAVRNFDYPQQKFEDSLGQDVLIDLSVSVKIVDPIKYEYNNENIEQELEQLISSSVRILINKSQYEQLKSKRFNVSEYMYKGNKYYKNVHTDINGNSLGIVIPFPTDFEKELCEMRNKLDEFADKYGLAVVDLYNKEVQQTEDIQTAFNKKILAEKEAEAKLIEKKAEQERAKIDAEIKTINAKAEAEANKLKYEAILKVLKDSNMTPEDQARFLQTFMYSNTNSQNIAGSTAAAVAGATAGFTSVMTENQTKKRKNI